MKPIHWLAVIPFIGMLVGPAVHNEVDPFILGMPFPLGWISVWVVLTAIIMASSILSIRRTAKTRHDRGPGPDRARRAGRPRFGPRRPRRAGHGPRAMGGGGGAALAGSSSS